MHHDADLDAKFFADEDDEEPWTFLRCIFESGASSQSKAAFLQRLPKDCLKHSPFESLRSDIVSGRYPGIKIIQQFVEEVQNDASIMSELVSYAITSLEPDSLFASEFISRLISMSSAPLNLAEIDNDTRRLHRFVLPYEYEGFSDSEEEEDEDGETIWRLKKSALVKLQYVSYKLDDDSTQAWSPGTVLYQIIRLCKLVIDLFQLKAGNLTLDEIMRLDLDLRLRRDDVEDDEVFAELAKSYSLADQDAVRECNKSYYGEKSSEAGYTEAATEGSAEKFIEGSNDKATETSIPIRVKVSSIRNWKPHLDELCAELWSKATAAQMETSQGRT